MTPFTNVTADPVANIYFGGKVVSHTIHLTDGSRKTLGIIYQGSYHFGTAAPEIMEITAGNCQVVLDGSSESKSYITGESFHIPANSGFTISVNEDLCQYICSFLPN